MSARKPASTADGAAILPPPRKVVPVQARTPTLLYLATIGTGNSTHTLVVSVDEQDPSDRDSFSLLASGATKILSTLQLPSKLPTS
jgi:hypothetical protein